MLKQKIQEELKQSMRDKNELRTSTVRMLLSAIKYFEIQKGGAGYDATEEDITDVLSKEIKKHHESIEMFEKGNRQELADKEKNELAILQTFLPPQMSEDEIKRIVDDAISKTGATEMSQMGKVMGIVIPQTKGKADATLVSKMVKTALNS